MFVRDDNVIKKRNVEDGAGLTESVCFSDVSGTRKRNSARMIVKKDDRGCVGQDCLLEDAPMIDLCRRKCPGRNHFLDQRQTCCREKENPGFLVVKRQEIFPDEVRGL